MCGIAGIVSERLTASGEAAPVVAEMLRRMRHRGPDGEGVHVHGPVALGAVRLAVIDTSEVKQPVVSHDGRLVIAYNGEVYNHAEVRAELETRGARFRTHTDTEVVLEAWRAFGADALTRLRGMFAFVILDRESGALFGARDRLGKKPLFLLRRDGLLAFASFLPALEAVPGASLQPDPRAVLDVLEVGWVNGPRSALAGVEQLPPAHAFTWRDGRFETFEYWSLAAQFRAGLGASAADSERRADEVAHLLRRAVRERLVSDVPLGSLLSGGLDSSLVTALMAQESTTRVRSFSIGFDDAGFDEREHAQLVADALGTEHHLEVLSSPRLDTLERAQWFLGEPLADTSVLPTFLVSEVARRGVTVALGGDGADELFAGYETYRADAVLAGLRRLPRWPLRPLLRAFAGLLPVGAGKVPFAYKAKRFAAGMDLPPAEAHAFWRALRTHAGALDLLLPEARAAVAEHAPLERFAALDEEVADCDLVNRCSYVDLRTYLVDDILVKVDRASMGWSLEARSPYLDHPVVEAVAQLPGHWKLRGRTTKWLLRQQARSLLPASTLRRRKEGFSAPVADWLAGPLRERFLELATPQRLEPLGLDAAKVRRAHAELMQRRSFQGWALWSVLVLALWNDLRSRPDPPPASVT